MADFAAPVRRWFAGALGAPTRAQALGWGVIRSGEHTLLLAPTGSGKTLAAFLLAIERLMFRPAPPGPDRCRVVYLSPLKALAVDVERNLRRPMAGISREAEAEALAFHVPEIAVRTGDTPPRERARFLRHPSDILITTPESLYLILTSAAGERLAGVECVIVDEIHAMVATKRGAHLALTLERLEEVCRRPFQRIGLSATQRPLEEVARFLGGYAPRGADGDPAPRPVRIVDAGACKELDLRVEVAVEDAARRAARPRPPSRNAESGREPTGVWPAIHPMLLDLIRKHHSTLIFLNSRRLAERLAVALNDLAGETIVHAHHGSLSREQRLEIEGALKAGRLPALVATSSLELGIDMGAIDLVIQVESPPSVSSGLQRIGRAGHRIDAASKGIIIPKQRGDLLPAAALTDRMRAGDVEPMRYLRNPLDVLAQQVVAMVAMREWEVEALEAVVRRAAPFRDLGGELLHGVLDMLSGRYPADGFSELRPRIVWDRAAGRLLPRDGSRHLAVRSGGTIPDRGQYPVMLAGAGKGGRVGELDEEMVFESRVGDTFLLGASTWRIEQIQHDRVLVSPAPGVPGRMPYWHGDAASRPAAFGRAIGELARTLLAEPEADARRRLVSRHDCSPRAARDLVAYLQEQARAGAVPDDRTIVVERCRDEMGEWRVCLLTPFGARVHAPWAMAIGALVRARTGAEADILWSDNGIVVRFPDALEPPEPDLLLPAAEAAGDLVVRQLAVGGGGARHVGQGAPVTALFASRFREAAARALLLPRMRPGKRTPLWQQRKRAADLLHVAAGFPEFPIMLETYRECLRDVFDMEALRELLRGVEERSVRVEVVDTRAPSPFAASLLFSYVANFMYEGDAPLAERRAQALTVDPVQLRQLLGDVELRDLLDPRAVEEVGRRVARQEPEAAARSADDVHDLLRALGDLSLEEISGRCAEPGALAGWLACLEAGARACRVTVAGCQRWIASEDAARYRDALGTALPTGLPPALLEPANAPTRDLVARYARAHLPFRAGDVAARLGLGMEAVTRALEELEADGTVARGEYLPGGSGLEWCHAAVLRALRQRSLSLVRGEVEPVEPETYVRFLLAWQGIQEPSDPRADPALARSRARGSAEGRLLEAVGQLQGYAIPASALEAHVLPARVPGYDPRDLDTLMAAGEVVWAGAGSLGERDGRVRLFLPEDVERLTAALAMASGPGPGGPVHDGIRRSLAERGAQFYPQLAQAVGGFPPEMLAALWELVWAGEVTNDTLRPLRARLHPEVGTRARRLAERGVRLPSRARAAAGGAAGGGLRSAPPEAAGRWSLVRAPEAEVAIGADPTDSIAALTGQLLRRGGLLTRDGLAAELERAGAVAGVLGVARAMEEVGHCRRGYFVAGLGAHQYGLPASVERLRGLRVPGSGHPVAVLAATDPANPYGASLAWPELNAPRRPGRAAGARVVIVDGALAAWLGPSGDMLWFGTDLESAAHVAGALARWERGPDRAGAIVTSVNGGPVAGSPMAGALAAAGFTLGSAGALLRP
ncbi:MAG: DEAD/DEAH box helicase [Chthonomonadales bacterium]|nr:DEAD/DEAH box helicase [Chthonomonadales bacterium]